MRTTLVEICLNLLESPVFDCSPNALHTFIGLLAVKEKRDPLPFWKNEQEGAVSICVSALARCYAYLSEGECRAAIEELKSKDLVVGQEPHWGIRRLGSYYQCRPHLRPRREMLPPRVRRKVLSIGHCVFCGSTGKLEVDHIFPVARGGGDEPSNLQPLCVPCNRSKGAKIIRK